MRYFWSLFLLLTQVATADCFKAEELTDGLPSGFTIGSVQLGIRAALRDSDPLLRDGWLGPYTRQRVVDLCQTVPRTDDLPALTSTLELAETYAALERWPALDRWQRRLARLPFETGADDGLAPLPLRMAGLTPIRAATLGGEGELYDCGTIAELALRQDPALDTLEILQILLGHSDLVTTCQALPVLGGMEDFAATLAHYARLERTRPNALATLLEKQFGLWLTEGSDERRLRLAGSLGAVHHLLDQYANRDQTASELTGPCFPPPPQSPDIYYELTAEDISGLMKQLNPDGVADVLTEQTSVFQSPRDLWNALEADLESILEPCVLPEVQTLVEGEPLQSVSFVLDTAGLTALGTEPGFGEIAAAIEELTLIPSPSEAILFTRVEALARSVIEAPLVEQMAATGELITATAEPLMQWGDIRVMEVERLPEEADPEALVITPMTLDILADTIPNPDFIHALANASFQAAKNPEQLRGDVLTVLRPVVESQVQTQLTLARQELAPLIRQQWQLSPELTRKILDLPYLKALTKEENLDGLQTQLAPLEGLTYPNERLLGRAIKDSGPFSEFMTRRLIHAAKQDDAEFAGQRPYQEVSAKGCGCARHAADFEEVYGFYPFWLTPRRGSTAEPWQIDFGQTTRLAFYGLSLDLHNDGSAAQIILSHEEHWAEARRGLLNSAHRHRTAVDLAFTLRNWPDWTDDHIEQAALKISTQMAPFTRFETPGLVARWQDLQTLFDPTRPDGVTLILEGYKPGEHTQEEQQKIVDIVEAIYAAIPERRDLEFNLAIDIDLATSNLNNRLLDEFAPLLINRDLVLEEPSRQEENAEQSTKDTDQDPPPIAREEDRLINRILLFMDRPTSDAKKNLRFRLEQGIYKGKDRRNVLRSLIPVLPPSAHELVTTNVEDAGPFSQFVDDLVYFEDNFAGVGFWPVPNARQDPETKKPAGETGDIFKAMNKDFFSPRFPKVLQPLEKYIGGLCSWTCPNRVIVSAAATLAMALTLLLTWRSFYNGWVNGLAFRRFMVGLVSLSNGAFIVLLILLTLCDPAALAPLVLLVVHLAALAVLGLIILILRARLGPKP